MIENPKIRISIENPLSNIFDLYSYQKNILINEKFITAFFTTLKSSKMDYFICESIYIYRINSILEKNKSMEYKSSIFNLNYDYLEDIEKVISKIFKIFKADGQTIILSLFLLEKINKNGIMLNENNIITLSVISLIETIKFNFDDPDIDGKLVCSVLKIDEDLLVKLEVNFLRIIDYKLKIDEDTFAIYKKKIMIPWIDYLKSLY
jgi:hypothetical protein